MKCIGKVILAYSAFGVIDCIYVLMVAHSPLHSL